MNELIQLPMQIAQSHGGKLAVMAALFLVAGIVPVPRTPLCFLAGALVGLAVAPVIALASTVGGVLAFLISRHLFRDQVERWLQRRRIIGSLSRAVEMDGWKIVALMRLYGPVPTTVQNYAFGLTRIPLAAYTSATLFFSLPQITFYVYLGATGRDLTEGVLPGWQTVVAVALAVGCLLTSGALVAARSRSILHDASVAARLSDSVAIASSARTPPA